MKTRAFWTLLALALTPFFVSIAFAEVPREKREALASVLDASFREQRFDQQSYGENSAAARPSEQKLRDELKSIHIEIGDGLAGRGRLKRTVEEI